jgi:hypothetical protein
MGISQFSSSSRHDPPCREEAERTELATETQADEGIDKEKR